LVPTFESNNADNQINNIMKTNLNTETDQTFVTTKSINNPQNFSIMKTLQISLLTLFVLMYALVNVQAAPINTASSAKDLKETAIKASRSYTINKFIEGVTSGNTKDFIRLLDDNFQQTVAYNGKSVTYNKSQFAQSLKLSKDIVMNCTTTYTVVEECDDLSIVKVEMKFPTFVKTSYVTMKPDRADEWKITNVSTVYGAEA